MARAVGMQIPPKDANSTLRCATHGAAIASVAAQSGKQEWIVARMGSLSERSTGSVSGSGWRLDEASERGETLTEYSVQACDPQSSVAWWPPRGAVLIPQPREPSFPPPANPGRPMPKRVPLALLVLVAAQSPGLTAQDYRARAVAILKTVPLIDGHNDIPDAIRERGGLDSVDFAVPQPKLMTDIPRLRAGAVGGQFWAAYVPVTTMDSGPHPAAYALEQIDLIKRLCARYPRDLAMAYSAADVERNFKAGKISCLMGIEGGHAIENSLGVLRMFAALGVRYITLTHWRSLSWATASTDTARRGLSACGRDAVREMNRLGIPVGLSHRNDGTMAAALH